MDYPGGVLSVWGSANMAMQNDSVSEQLRKICARCNTPFTSQCCTLPSSVTRSFNPCSVV